MLPKGSRAIALEENCLQAPKLTLSQTLNLTGRQLFSRTIVWLPPTLKLTLTLTQIPTLTEEQFSSGAIVRIPFKEVWTFLETVYLKVY